nr:tripartite tricarboxylate transporter substrate-binding protein [Alcaligenes phenolicus]
MVAEEAGKVLGQPVIVENRVGGSGAIGLSAAARSAADGYTWVIGTGGNMITAPLIQKNQNFDVEKDFRAISMLAPLPMLIVVRPDYEVSNMEDLVKLAQSKPGEVDYGSLGVGSFPHLAGELLKTHAQVDLLHVPYKGSSQALTDLMGGRVDIMFDTVPPAMTQIRAGKLKALAITSANESVVAPGIPPVSASSGLESYESLSWTGMFVPAGTPDAIVEKINAVVLTALNNQAIKERFLEIGVELKGTSPQEFDEFVKSERKKWTEIAANAGLEAH